MYHFKVEGLHCGSCVDGLEDALKLIDSKGKIEADFEEEKLEVRTVASPEAIKRMIEEAGYKVLRYQTIV